jgi:hypothetical protein
MNRQKVHACSDSEIVEIADQLIAAVPDNASKP